MPFWFKGGYKGTQPKKKGIRGPLWVLGRVLGALRMLTKIPAERLLEGPLADGSFLH